MDAVTVRWSEYQYYCIDRDKEIVRLMATTGKGTWVAEVEIGLASILRRDRAAFKEYVLEHIEDQPEELEF